MGGNHYENGTMNLENNVYRLPLLRIVSLVALLSLMASLATASESSTPIDTNAAMGFRIGIDSPILGGIAYVPTDDVSTDRSNSAAPFVLSPTVGFRWWISEQFAVEPTLTIRHLLTKSDDLDRTATTAKGTVLGTMVTGRKILTTMYPESTNVPVCRKRAPKLLGLINSGRMTYRMLSPVVAINQTPRAIRRAGVILLKPNVRNGVGAGPLQREQISVPHRCYSSAGPSEQVRP